MRTTESLESVIGMSPVPFPIHIYIIYIKGTQLTVLMNRFDGLTTSHKFTIHSTPEQQVIYQSRHHADQLLQQVRRTGKLDGITFGQKRDPCESFFKKVKTVWEPVAEKPPGMENIGVAFQRPLHMQHSHRAANNSVKEEKLKRGGNMLSLTTDKTTTKEFDLDTLEPIGTTNQRALHPDLTGHLAAAHACTDPANRDIYNYNLAFGAAGACYRVFCTSADTGITEVLATISGSDIKPAYLHSLFLTKHFVVLCIWPALFRQGGARILWERNVLDAIGEFDEREETVWVIISRNGGGVVNKFASEAFFAFHTVNAWEEDAEDGRGVDVFAEVVTYKNSNVLHRFYYDNLVSNGSGVRDANKSLDKNLSLSRFKLASIPTPASTSIEGKNAKSQTRKAELVQAIPGPRAGELPRINPAYEWSKKHRYVYSVTDSGKSSFVDAIGKTDTETGECKVWRVEGHTPSEPIFVPAVEVGGKEVGVDERGSERDEDDGAVMTVVLDGNSGKSYLLCLDARDLSEVARAEVDSVVGLGFHGLHLPA